MAAVALVGGDDTPLSPRTPLHLADPSDSMVLWRALTPARFLNLVAQVIGGAVTAEQARDAHLSNPYASPPTVRGIGRTKSMGGGPSGMSTSGGGLG